MADILITEPIENTTVERLRMAFDVVVKPELWRDTAAVIRQIQSCRGVIVRNQTEVTQAVIDAADRLLVIGRAGVGLDNIDLGAASSAGIVVCTTPQENAISVAELVLGFMLCLARRICEADRHVKGGAWDRHHFVGAELHGKTLGIVGFGRIGFLTAMRARAFGMEIIAHDEYLNSNSILLAEAGARLVPMDDLLMHSDFVSCHVPLTPETRGMFDARRFALMKSTAYFINASRGQVVNERDLANALEEEVIAGAALDVRQAEPPAPDALSRRDDVVLTPHIAAFTQEAQARVLHAICDDVTGILEGRRAVNAVNFPFPQRGEKQQ